VIWRSSNSAHQHSNDSNFERFKTCLLALPKIANRCQCNQRGSTHERDCGGLAVLGAACAAASTTPLNRAQQRATDPGFAGACTTSGDTILFQF